MRSDFVLPVIDRFNDWFSSALGVLQTAVIVLIVAALDAAGLIQDRSGYWLLWALTVYSAVTQPALAYSGVRANDRTGEVLERLSALEARTARLIKELEIRA